MRLNNNSMVNRASVTYDNRQDKTMNNDILDMYSPGAITPDAHRVAMMTSKLGRILDHEIDALQPMHVPKITEKRLLSPINTHSPAGRSVISPFAMASRNQAQELNPLTSSEMSSTQMLKHNSTKAFGDNGNENYKKVKKPHRMDLQVRNLSSKLVIGGQ